MWRKIHKLILILAVLNYISLVEVQEKAPTQDISQTIDYALIVVIILAGIWVIDILFNLIAYIRGTAKGMIKDPIKKGIIKTIMEILK